MLRPENERIRPMEIYEAKPIGKSWTEAFLTDDYVFPLCDRRPVTVSSRSADFSGEKPGIPWLGKNSAGVTLI